MKHFRSVYARATLLVAVTLFMAGCSVMSGVDAVTYLDALAVKDVNLAAVPNGTYAGEYTLALPPGQYAMYRHISVQVTVAGGAYTGIVILDPPSLAVDSGFLGLIDRIETKNSLAVDAVSGATYSSKAMLKAVEAAVTP